VRLEIPGAAFCAAPGTPEYRVHIHLHLPESFFEDRAQLESDVRVLIILVRREPDFGAQAHLDWKPIFWQREPRANVPPDDILTAGAIRCEEVTSKLEMLADAPSQLEGDVRLPFVVAE